MRQEDWSELNGMVVASTLALFTAQGATVKYVGCEGRCEAGSSDTISIIGLGGGSLRGSLVLRAQAGVLAATHPTNGTSEEDLADWLGELANQLLGRVKRELLARGVPIEMSTPITLSASSFRFHRFKGMPVTHCFEVDGAIAHVMFEAIGDDVAQLSQGRDSSVALNLGEVVLF